MRNMIFLRVLFFVVVFLLSTSSFNLKAEARWWDKLGKPKYGDTITITDIGITSVSFNNYSLIGSGDQFWLESLFSKINWTTDRNEWDYMTAFTPEQYVIGNLAESWERPDMQSLIIHLRKGIHWQNKPPVNGREFTAYDVQAHYDRMLGTGGGYTTPAPTYLGFTPNWERVVALDRYTVKLTFTKPTGSIGLLSIMETMSLNTIEAPEWVALGGPPSSSPPKGSPPKGGPPKGGPPSFGSGPLQDWHNAVGTGPWILTDYISNSSITWTRNPDYWGYDERYPENKLPYADKLKKLLIGDPVTKLAALRTGKIDTMNITQQEFDSLKKSNPDIQYIEITRGAPLGAPGVTFRVDKEPFTNIRVRKALQLSLDIKTIAKSLGIEAIPCGLISPSLKGHYYAYKDWPESLKDEYSYNPEKARKLLAEAGYPEGFDTNVVISPFQDVAMFEIIKAYFKDIGVNLEIKTMDPPTMRAFTAAGKHDQMTPAQSCLDQAPTATLSRFYSKNRSVNTGFVNDPTYDALIQQLYVATGIEHIASIMVDADKRVIEQHWMVTTVPSISYNVWQPFLKGYMGENQTSYAQGGWLFARLWINRE